MSVLIRSEIARHFLVYVYRKWWVHLYRSVGLIGASKAPRLRAFGLLSDSNPYLVYLTSRVQRKKKNTETPF